VTTREAIIAAAMQGFAEKGFEATSIREIAALAHSNVASISYHFGGKEGLRAACAAHVVDLMGEVLAAGRAVEPPADPAEAERSLAALVRNMTSFLLLRPEARLIAGFMLREMAHPSSALDTVYEGLFESVHTRVCSLWGVAVGHPPETESVRLAVFSLIGQILYFHICRPVVERRMDWTAIGPAEAEAVADTVTRNLSARLAADRSSLR
jgi:AcrR family transcriptional regulator